MNYQFKTGSTTANLGIITLVYEYFDVDEGTVTTPVVGLYTNANSELYCFNTNSSSSDRNKAIVLDESGFILGTNTLYNLTISKTGSRLDIYVNDSLNENTITNHSGGTINKIFVGRYYTSGGSSYLTNGEVDLNNLNVSVNHLQIFKGVNLPDFTLPAGEIYGMTTEATDGEFVYVDQTNNANLISTATSLTTHDITSKVRGFLPFDNISHSYECTFCYTVVSSGNTTASQYWVYVNSNVICIDYIDSESGQSSVCGGQYTAILKPTDKMELSFKGTVAPDSHNTYLVGYKRLAK